MYQALCDGDTNTNSSKKRCSKAVDNTEDMFDICLKRHLNSEVNLNQHNCIHLLFYSLVEELIFIKALKGSALFAVIEGGYESMARKKSITNVLDKPVQGFVIDGLHNNEKEVLKLNFNLVKPILQETLVRSGLKYNFF
jgi:queuine/archaeosine tRNA-ribosyltransferase